LSTLFSQEAGAAQVEDRPGAGRDDEPAAAQRRHPILAGMFAYNRDIPVAACYLSYFGVAFFALRWWKMADRRRPHRFSLFSVLAAGFWAYLLLCLWPWPEEPLGVVALVLSAVIVQLVSPWEQPPPPRARRLRLRYA